MRIVLNEIYVQGGMKKLEQAEFDKAKEKKVNEKQKALMHSLFASLTAVKKVDADGNSKYIYLFKVTMIIEIDPKTILCPMF